MGFFGNLFEKKHCDICGGEIGLFGNRKLEDGNLCKDCAAKLSPWFTERKQSTVEEIRGQLEYREQNKAAVSAFRVTRTLGRNTKVLIDENAGKFMISSQRNVNEENPDVIDLAQVTGCSLDIQEDRSEDTRTEKQEDGSTTQVSYDPPHYTYSYDFRIIIHVNHPYFNEISFRINSSSVDIETIGPISGGIPGAVPQEMPGAEIANALLQIFTVGTTNSGGDPRTMNPEYVEYLNMGNEIKAALLQTSVQAREERAAAAAPKQPVICTACGATTVPDANGCCEYCGSPLNR